jgi:hypothetical protein
MRSFRTSRARHAASLLGLGVLAVSCAASAPPAAPAAATGASAPAATPAPAASPTPAAPPEPAATPAPAAGTARAIEDLKAAIAGREDQPAETVFKNIQIFKGVPAGRVLAIMQMGFSPALGVDCTHCHVTGQWESDAAKEKQVAREMFHMTRDINQKYLPAIKGIDSEKPAVSCTTCHRGQVKPALSMPPRAGG